MDDKIKIRGARQHNLKNVDLDIPKNKLVIFTGVSGSGKSSLAHDTIYAEGQRRYVESLSTYARQFLGVMKKPEVDVIEGLSPAISIDQKTTSRNPRSTVGTVTEIYDYMRLLFARVGHPHCPVCGREITNQSIDEIVSAMLQQIEDILKNQKSIRFFVLAPLVRDKKGEFASLFENLKAKGFRKVRVDNHIKELEEEFVLIKTNKHTIEAVVDKFSMTQKDMKDKIFRENLESRMTDSVSQALKISDGLVLISEIKDPGFEFPKNPKKFQDYLFSERFACPVDNIQIPEIEPRTFSFNSPHGACPKCNGIGKILKVEKDLLFAPELSIKEGGVLPYANMFEHDTWFSRLILKVCQENDINPKAPIKTLKKEKVDILLNGSGDKEYRVDGKNRQGRMTYIYEVFDGFVAEIEKRHKNTESDWVRNEMEKYMREKECPDCGGARLKKEALSITIDKKSIHAVTNYSIKETLGFISSLIDKNILSEKERNIGEPIIKEIQTRLKFLVSVGLSYLDLARSAGTLSGGEAQRIRLASQIGSGLTGVLYVLDEPTIGLHQRDNQKLINTLKNLRDLGNSVVVVEHDEDMMRQSDYIVDFGPGAGKHGGRVIAKGTPEEIEKDENSVTGKYLTGKNIKIEKIKIEKEEKKKLTLKKASQFNLKSINVDFPLQKLVSITGVSGSGKSTLLVETLYPALYKHFNPSSKVEIGEHSDLEGVEAVDKVILIDQSPIGRTPRSNPATYTKLFDYIRGVYAETREAKAAGFKKGRFSFNVKGGRCEACEGQGQIKIEMQFMSDIWVTCEVCEGARYNAQTLEIRYKGKSISDVLKMTVDEAEEFFHAHKNIVKKLETLKAVGLGYIELGQPATTLSGGEAQRVKLATELAKRATGNTVYILDEPTTGLHFADIEKLLRVLRLLVAKGNSVFIIEHNLDVIRNSDWIIDLGPDGGENGGEVVTAGRPPEVAKVKKSYTGQYLKK